MWGAEGNGCNAASEGLAERVSKRGADEAKEVGVESGTKVFEAEVLLLTLGEEFLACSAGETFCVRADAVADVVEGTGLGLGGRGLADGFGKATGFVSGFFERCGWGCRGVENLVLSEAGGQAREGLNGCLGLRGRSVGGRISVVVDAVADAPDGKEAFVVDLGPC